MAWLNRWDRYGLADLFIDLSDVRLRYRLPSDGSIECVISQLTIPFERFGVALAAKIRVSFSATYARTSNDIYAYGVTNDDGGRMDFPFC